MNAAFEETRAVFANSKLKPEVLEFIERHADRQIDLSESDAGDADVLLTEISEAGAKLASGCNLDVSDFMKLYAAASDLLLFAHRALERECNAGPDAEAQ